MIRRITRAAAGLLAAFALAGTVGSAKGSAAPSMPSTDKGTVTESDASASLTYRGSYWTYHDCDVTGFSGIYYGWWTAYICQWRNGANVWDLYAG